MAQKEQADAGLPQAPRTQQQLDSAEIGTYRLDEVGTVLDIDHALFRMLDLQHSYACPEDCLGEPFETLAAPGSLRRLLAIQTSQGGLLLAHDFPILTRIGNRKWTRHYSRRVREEGGKERFVEGLVLNATWTRERRARLGTELSMFEQYLAMSAGGLWEIEFPRAGEPESDARRVYLSPRCKSYIGYGPEDFPDSVEAWQERIHPGDLEQMRGSAKRHLEGGIDLHEVEYRIRHRDGSLRWIHSRARIERDPDGSPRRWQGIDWDITELRKRDQDPEPGAPGLERILGSLRRGVVEVDTAGRITYVNQALCSMLGYERRELLAQRTVDFCPTKEERAKMQAYLRRLVRERPECAPYRTRRRCKDGSVLELEVEWDYRSDSGGKLLGFVGVVTDITERVRAERALQRSARLEASATLAAGMAHRFNNLMICVLGNAELLESQLGEATDGSDLLRSIAESAGEATDLIGQLLSFSRQGPRRVEPLQVNGILSEFLAKEKPAWPEEVQVSFTRSEDLWLVVADADQIARALAAVCRNSVEAVGDSGTVRIEACNVTEEIEGGENSRPRRWVRVTVDDDGMGMDAETLSRVYEPFFTTKFQGRGLGLSAAHGIVQSHGGRISLHSEAGRGTTAIIDLAAKSQES